MAKTKEITICNYDIIYNKTHKPSAVYKYFQQIATEDLDTFKLDSKTLFDKGIAFVLARMKTKFYKPLICYDNLVLSSCHRRTKGVSFISTPFGIPEIIGIAVTAILHLWKRQMLISIAGGTAVYMFLVQAVF